jgi:hypothetical protein
MGSVVLGLGVLPPDGVAEDMPPDALTIQVWSVDDDYHMSVVDPDGSPWNHHTYLGEMRSRNEVLGSPHKALFFDIARSIVQENPAVAAYLETQVG